MKFSQASKLKQQGVSAEEASKRIDMSAHKDHYPPNTNLAVNRLGVQRGHGNGVFDEPFFTVVAASVLPAGSLLRVADFNMSSVSQAS